MQLTWEQQQWMARQSAKLQQKEVRGKTAKPITAKPITAKPITVPKLSDNEIAWLWPRFQKCGHGIRCFAKSFAKTNLDKLTPKGKAIVHSVAYPFRKQLFKNSAKWTEGEFIAAVRSAANGASPS